ncbi:hypothetical protein CU669_03385 [Paramagnetospirillum kuznetsovii]|uniref:Uncharacterized protein n=1 Tax=Paramagnetospirillum kuznetsovii TaxID=2053833 RepID=A0A364P1M4_9PROT|nr:hypothetical protein [Paramagnetospirillum kuznetsovii]RAU23213.1 hypothetical protein CU669_03385 [Paramagnetospirillum kuznetsovii]
MFKRKVLDAQIGDVFIKTHDTKRNLWVVEKLFEHVDGIMHARLFNKNQPKTMITVSASTLIDADFFQRAPVAPQAD